VNKTAPSAAQLANCLLPHAFSHITAAPSWASTNKTSCSSQLSEHKQNFIVL